VTQAREDAIADGMSHVPSVLFVCLGNICRSPLAEAAFRAEAGKLELEAEVDSAGTGDWHVGEPPDRRAIAVARRNGVDIADLRARQVRADDFERFDHIIALDRNNLSALRRLRPPGSRAEISLLLDHVEGREGQAVADPYYGDDSHFDLAWKDVTEGAAALARRIAGV
jgi:protein-tyrosine phosphatase